MSKTQYFIKNQAQPMVPYEEGVALRGNVSISDEDRKNGSPKKGDWIATNPNNPSDRWLISAEFHAANYIPQDTGKEEPMEAPKEDTFLSRLKTEEGELLLKFNKLDIFLGSKKFKKLSQTDQALLNQQYLFMSLYMDVLKNRISFIETGTEPELTFGQKAVGFTFNPSFTPEVDWCKTIHAIAIDQMNQLRMGTRPEGMKRHASVAITDIETAKMRAVTAITWRE